MSLNVWLPLVRTHHAKVSPSRLGLLATITTAAAFNSVVEPLCRARFRRQLAKSKPSDPLFIIGHWRSGTTLLHELLMLDEKFFCPTTYQCFAPGHFLLTEKLITSALSWIMPDKRPMDNVAAGWHRPQEDEFALTNLGAPSPYRRMAFPVTSPCSPEALDISKLPPEELEHWKHLLQTFLKTLSVRDDRQPVLKSPPHTARVGVLAEMFPNAKFLHIIRDPYVVFPSTLRLWRSLHEVQALQVDTGDSLEEYVYRAFDEMYHAFERDKENIGADRLYEIRYEDLIANPVDIMSHAYNKLNIGDFEKVRDHFEKQAQAMKNYKTNTYDLEPRLIKEITTRWGPFIDRYGYQTPTTDSTLTDASSDLA